MILIGVHMVVIRQRITIIQTRRPARQSLNEELQFFGNSLGLFNMRDKDQSCFRIFIELLKAAKLQQPRSSDELAYKLKLSRGTVVHHINKLMESGIVVHEANRYLLRVNNLEVLVEEIKRDVNRSLENLKNIAKEIDLALGL